MRTKGTRLLSAMMALVMVLGAMVVIPLTASAYHSSDALVKDGTITGSPIPEDAVIYDGTPATSFAGGSGTKDDPYLISNAKEFVYFRDVHLPALLETRTIESAFSAGSNSAYTYTKTVTATDGTSTSEEITVKQWQTAKISTACAVGAQNSQLYYKLTGDIYLNNETYGSSGKGYQLNGISKTLSKTDHIEIGADESGALYVMDDAAVGDGTYTTIIHNADGTTTTYSAATGASISIKSKVNLNGELDGDGHTIYNVYEYVASHENSDQGLFGTLNGTVKNLNIDGLRFGSGYGDQERHKFGGIATFLYGTV